MLVPFSGLAVQASARLRATNIYLVDTAVAVAVAVPLSVPFLTIRSGHVSILGAILNAGTVVPLVWRRRSPFVVVVVVFLFGSAVSLYARPGQMLQYAGLVAVYTVACFGRRWQRLCILWLILLTFPPASLLLKHNTLPEFMFTVLLPLTAYLVGALVRVNRAHAQALAERNIELERARELDTARARAEERTRIAHDMHDILGHAVSVMVVQAEAGPVVVRTDPDRAEQAFDVIADAGRSAMVQLARMLGVLKDEDTSGVRVPQPAVAGIPSLVEQVRRAGVSVVLSTSGVPRSLPADAELAAYRIVQEALTNTLKHAAAQSVAVRLDWHDDLVITVSDDGGCPEGGARPSGGYGLVGIQERAAACGGRVEAGPTAAGFLVTAWLPIARAVGEAGITRPA